jgi:hypothetical protein
MVSVYFLPYKQSEASLVMYFQLKNQAQHMNLEEVLNFRRSGVQSRLLLVGILSYLPFDTKTFGVYSQCIKSEADNTHRILRYCKPRCNRQKKEIFFRFVTALLFYECLFLIISH